MDASITGEALVIKSGDMALGTTMTAWEVVSWIAFRDLRPHPDGPDAEEFTSRWGDSAAATTLQALEARAASAPTCLWQPRIRVSQPWDGRTYHEEVSSPRGPSVLR